MAENGEILPKKLQIYKKYGIMTLCISAKGGCECFG